MALEADHSLRAAWPAIKLINCLHSAASGTGHGGLAFAALRVVISQESPAAATQLLGRINSALESSPTPDPLPGPLGRLLPLLAALLDAAAAATAAAAKLPVVHRRPGTSMAAAFLGPGVRSSADAESFGMAAGSWKSEGRGAGGFEGASALTAFCKVLSAAEDEVGGGAGGAGRGGGAQAWCGPPLSGALQGCVAAALQARALQLARVSLADGIAARSWRLQALSER